MIKSGKDAQCAYSGRGQVTITPCGSVTPPAGPMPAMAGSADGDHANERWFYRVSDMNGELPSVDSNPFPTERETMKAVQAELDATAGEPRKPLLPEYRSRCHHGDRDGSTRNTGDKPCALTSIPPAWLSQIMASRSPVCFARYM